MSLTRDDMILRWSKLEEYFHCMFVVVRYTSYRWYRNKSCIACFPLFADKCFPLRNVWNLVSLQSNRSRFAIYLIVVWMQFVTTALQWNCALASSLSLQSWNWVQEKWRSSCQEIIRLGGNEHVLLNVRKSSGREGMSMCYLLQRLICRVWDRTAP